MVLLAAMFVAATLAAQQPAPKPADPDEVVATVEGEKITPRRIRQLRDSLPPPFRQSTSAMDDKTFLRSYAELLTLSRLAEQQKVAEREPYSHQLAFVRMNFLAQSYLDFLKTRTTVSAEEVKAYYDDHLADYEEAQVRAIYVAFSPSAPPQTPADPKAKRPLSEDEARAKAASLAAALKKGADFAAAAKKDSDDAASAEKGGDIGSIKRGSTGVPAEVRNVIFGLKPGQVSDPLRQPAGFYIFKVEARKVASHDEVAATIAPTVQGLKIQAEIKKILGGIKISYDNEAFFSQPPSPAAPKTP